MCGKMHQLPFSLNVGISQLMASVALSADLWTVSFIFFKIPCKGSGQDLIYSLMVLNFFRGILFNANIIYFD